MARSETAEQILNAAERMARTGGYNSFSFRDIAGEIGIKSASIHYHFPAKAALGVALVERYTDTFLNALGSPDDGPAQACLARFVGAFRTALVNDGQMCLCGILSAEVRFLPEEVTLAARDFWKRNLAWLTHVFGRDGHSEAQAAVQAERMMALLEGAMILAQGQDDLDAFDRITAPLPLAPAMGDNHA